MSDNPQPSVQPWDVHNQKLAANVHPADWHNPTSAWRYNLVVIGAGTAGLVTAAGAAGLGAKVALIEKHFRGGDCLNVGCVPSKALIRAGRAVAEVRRAAELGVNVSLNSSLFVAADVGPLHSESGEVRADSRRLPQLDFSKDTERMRRLRAEISPHDSAAPFRELGVDVYRLQTTNSRIYACGDICSPYQFAHAADFQARLVIQNALFKGRARASSLVIPWCTCTSPEIAHVGLCEKDAKDKGISVDMCTTELSQVDRAILDGDTDGFVRVAQLNGCAFWVDLNAYNLLQATGSATKAEAVHHSRIE